MQIKYKHFTLSILLSLWTAVCWAQAPVPQVKENWELKGTEPIVSDSYVARDYIKLQNNGSNAGFSFKAETGKSFNAKIDAGLLFPPNDKTYAVTAPDGSVSYNSTQGAVVGSIPGSASVTPTGAATYQIPIEVPAGINGMQPQVSIVYNSQGGFGTLGIGWELSGGSAITCGGKNMYFDGINDGIKLGVTDALYLDGQRLILLSGTHFQVGAEYGTEVENYTRVKIAESPNTWSIYFIVTTKDGKIMEYGNTINSWQKSALWGNPWVLASKLNKVTDTYGNSMNYTYSDNGQYLQKIEYAGQSVEFAYNYTLPVAKKSYIKDFLISHTKLLTAITTKSGTTVLKTVGFSYKSTTDTRLDKVSTTARDNSKLKETIINWGDDVVLKDDFYANKITLGAMNDVTLSEADGSSTYFADVNGDGHPDRIQLWAGSKDENGSVNVYLYNEATTPHYPFDYTFHKEFNWNSDKINVKIMCQDIDKNGKDEILLFDVYTITVYSFDNNSLLEKVIPFRGNTQFIQYGVTWIPKPSVGGFTSLFEDVNKDSYPDLVIIPLGEFDGVKKYSQIFYGSSTGYDASNSEYAEFTVADCRIYATGGWDGLIGNGDFNADGKSDIMVYGGGINKTSPYVDDYKGATVFFNPTISNLIKDGNDFLMYDFDNDGLTDIIYQQDDNNGYSWKMLKNQGNFISTQISTNLPFNPSSKSNTDKERQFSQIIDYNGDGFMDVIIADETWQDHDGWTWLTGLHDFVETNWYFYKNNFGSFVLEKQYTTSDRFPEMRPTISDINGDGIQDLILANSQNSYAITLPNATRRNIVTGITNGMGQTNSFTYKNFSNYDQTATSGVIRNLKAPIMVVDTQTEPDESVTTFTFERPKVHTEGKGFMVFSTVKAVNPTKNTKIVSNYEIEPTYFGVNLQAQTVCTTNNLVVSRSRQYNGVRGLIDNPKRYIPIVTAQWSFDSIRNVVQTTRINYDSYPTISQTSEIKDSTTNVIDLTTTVVNIFTGPDGCLIPYLPATVTKTLTQNGGSATRVTAHAYEYNGFQITKSTETTDPDKPQYAVSTEYSNPDAWGHMRNIAIKAKDQTGAEITRGSSMSYTASGRFVATKTNLLSETTTYNWNETLGLLDIETTRIGDKDRTTTYTYNTRGDLFETRYPDGNRKTAVVQWAGTDGVTGAKYYTHSEASGSAPVKVWYDALGREIQKETYGLDATKKIIVNTEYITSGVNKGKVNRVSEPYFEGDTKAWATYAYNPDYGYVSSVTTPVGTTVTAYDKLKTTVTSPEGTTETVTNAAGLTMSSIVNSKKVSYEYYPNGLTKSSTPEGGLPITMKYNSQGKRTLLVDPDGGTIRTENNGFGGLTKEVQLIHMNQDSIVTINSYDGFGRLLTIKRNNEITTYTYDTNNKSRVNSIAIANKNTQTFEFDDLDRVIKITEDITANGTTKTFISRKVYDALGRIKKEIYPSGYYTLNTYDLYSNLKEVKDNANRSIWKANTENALGQATSIFKGAKETTYGYDPVNHQMTSVYANGIIDYTYGYYAADGTNHANNLEWRSDGTQSEHFIYDDQNRLTQWDVTRSGTTTCNSMGFDDNGNITQKSDLGAFTMYYGGKNPNGSTNGRPNGTPIGPHALSAIGGVPTSFPQVELPNSPTAELNVTYTDFKKISTLTEKNKYYELTYGVDDQRRMSVFKESGVTKLTRYYMGNYEEEVVGTNVRKIHYLSGAILIQNSNSATDSLLYTYSDAQGSLIALTDANGGLLIKTVNGTSIETGRFAYDPWGAHRDPTDWTQKDSRTSFIINRGYTGHEHLDAFGIINMNGRVYDPLTAQFFSPDPYVQAQGDWLNYNRYSYCINNPFKYTDPSGNFFYVIPSFSYSYYGGLQVNVSAGIGVPGAASYGITLGYNFKYENWSATANASFMGTYAYAGFDSKAGFIAGVGFGFSSPIYGISSNLLGASINYSAEGGFNLSMFGFNMGNNGVNFDPSITASTTLVFGKTAQASKQINQNKNSVKMFNSEAEFNEWVDNNIDRKDFGLNKTSIVDDPNYIDGNVKYWRNPSDGLLYEVNLITHSYQIIGGVTIRNYNGWGGSSDIYVNNSGDCEEFTAKFDHELIHSFHNSMFLNQMQREKHNSYTEHIAYQFYYDNGFRSQGVIDMLNSTSTGFYPIIMPPYLIPIK